MTCTSMCTAVADARRHFGSNCGYNSSLPVDSSDLGSVGEFFFPPTQKGDRHYCCSFIASGPCWTARVDPMEIWPVRKIGCWAMVDFDHLLYRRDYSLDVHTPAFYIYLRVRQAAFSEWAGSWLQPLVITLAVNHTAKCRATMVWSTGLGAVAAVFAFLEGRRWCRITEKVTNISSNKRINQSTEKTMWESLLCT